MPQPRAAPARFAEEMLLTNSLPAPSTRRGAVTPIAIMAPYVDHVMGFIDPTGVNHDAIGVALRKALYNYMHGLGLDEDVRSWFNGPVPKTKVARHRIARALAAPMGLAP